MKPSPYAAQLFKGRVFILTGGGRGIGLGVEQYLTALGAVVVTIEAPKVADTLQNKNSYAVDLRDSKRIVNLINEVDEEFGRCDGLICNARAGIRTPPLQEDVSNLQENISVGLVAPMILSQAFIKYAKDTASIPRSIVNISSTAALRVTNESAAYHSTKGAVESLTKYLAVYAGVAGVRVNAIAPGFIVKQEHRDKFFSEANKQYRETALRAHPLDRIGNEWDVAAGVSFLLSDASSFITGHTLVIDGGLTLRDNFATLVSDTRGKLD